MLQKEFAQDASLPDGSTDPRRLEMRAVLEEPIGQKYVGQFAKKAMTQVRAGAGNRVHKKKSAASFLTRTAVWGPSIVPVELMPGLKMPVPRHNTGEIGWRTWD